MPDKSSQPNSRLVGRFEVIRELGSGAFGVVYLVRDTWYPTKQVALKVLRPKQRDAAGLEARFLSEIEILRSLRHDGIPQIFDTGRTDAGELYFTMEFVDGVTLATVLRDLEQRRERLAPERMVAILQRVLQVLNYAHSRGVVHRDLKPGNIMLVRPGTSTEDVRLLDFGIAKVVRGSTDGFDLPTLNTSGGIGTPHYMSPEQLRGQPVDGRTDLYALGVMLYQMCAGRMPFKGDDVAVVITEHLFSDPDPLPDDPPTPDWMRALVFSLLERSQDKRPSTREVLELLLRRESMPATVPLPTPAEHASIPTQPNTPPPRASQPRSRATTLGAAFVALLVLSLAAWALFFRGENEKSAAGESGAGEVAKLNNDAQPPSKAPSAPADRDGDGTLDDRDLCPDDPNKTAPGICGCGAADTDSDNDGTLDCHDRCPQDPNKIAPGVCGCGVPDTDTDGDGALDCKDGCPNDPKKTAPGRAGCGNPEPDERLAWAEVLEAQPDPTVVTDAQLRAAIQATGLPWRVRDRRSKIELLLVPPGSYRRGASPGDTEAWEDEFPVQNVQITKAFYLGRYEVMESEWKRVIDNVDGSMALEIPQRNVSHDDIAGWLARAPGLRLPTEGEWEYACRAGTGSARYGELSDVAVCFTNSARSVARVGTKRANALGFHDMLGNVYEWCSDWYDGYSLRGSGVSDPPGPPSGMARVLRGCSFEYVVEDCRASSRRYDSAVSRDVNYGFRVSRTP
jgi:serine/threonine protein kinase/formylglycine-generating enzyme required for sulfatase activity